MSSSNARFSIGGRQDFNQIPKKMKIMSDLIYFGGFKCLHIPGIIFSPILKDSRKKIKGNLWGHPWGDVKKSGS